MESFVSSQCYCRLAPLLQSLNRNVLLSLRLTRRLRRLLFESAVDGIFASFNRRDLEAYGEFWADSSLDFTGAFSREQERKWAEEAFANYKDIQAEQIKEIGIDFLKPDVAIQRRAMTFTSSSGPDGKPVPPVYGLRSSVFMKKNGKWIVVAQFGRQMTEEEIKQLTE